MSSLAVMPEIFVNTSWPDGSQLRCYSPSLVVEEYFTAGGTYAVPDFVERSREALTIASERVRAKYGFACTSAMSQLDAIVNKAATVDSAGLVTVDGFDR